MLDQRRIDLVMQLTSDVRGQCHAHRELVGNTLETELAILDQAEATLADAGLDADEQLAARIRYAQFRCGTLAIHQQDAEAAEQACLALLTGRAAGPVSQFMQARVGMLVMVDRAIHDHAEFPQALFNRYLVVVATAPGRADDEFWFFTTLYAYKQRWTEVLEQAEERLASHWEDSSGMYLYKRVKLMRKLLKGSAKEGDCGQTLQAINHRLFADEFYRHLLVDCDRAGIMTPLNMRIWTERQAEFGLRFN